jgi:hypothetical protein
MAMKPKWSDVKRRLKDLESRELVSVIKDLFDASVENRRFLAARILQNDLGPEVLESFRAQIHESFFTPRGSPQEPLRLAEGRKAIRDYRNATDDVEGTLHLMLTFVESGTDFTLKYGDIDERFYNTLTSALNDIEELLSGEGHALYASFRDRLQALAHASCRIGWGYGDDVKDLVAELEDRFGVSESTN